MAASHTSRASPVPRCSGRTYTPTTCVCGMSASPSTTTTAMPPQLPSAASPTNVSDEPPAALRCQKASG